MSYRKILQPLTAVHTVLLTTEVKFILLHKDPVFKDGNIGRSTGLASALRQMIKIVKSRITVPITNNAYDGAF